MKTIDIWGSIVPHGYEQKVGDFSSLAMKFLLEEANGQDVHVRIQTIGGNVVEGVAIYNLLQNYSGRVITENMGISGSIGSLIFLAGKDRITYRTSSFFIHEASGGKAEDLDMYNNILAETYSSFSDKTKEFFLDEMKKETTYNGQQTYDLGFATEIKEDLKAVALMEFYENKMDHLNLAKGEKMAKDEKAPEASIEDLQNQIVALQEKIEANDKLILEKDAEIEKIKAEQEEKVQIALKAEKERENEILASIAHPSQLEFAKDLVAKGETVVNAKIALFDDLRANKDTYLKVEKEQGVDILEAQAPKGKWPTRRGKS